MMFLVENDVTYENVIYSEKQLKDIKKSVIFLTFAKIHTYLIVLSICSFSGCKMQFTLHWLQYTTAPNVLTFYIKTYTTLKLSFISFNSLPRKEII